MPTCTYDKNLKHVPRDQIKDGMVLVCGDESHRPTTCWTKKSSAIPFRVTINPNGTLHRVSLDDEKPDSNSSINDGCDCDDKHHLYLVKNIKNVTKNPMKNITENFVLLLTKEPQKSFRKAGITDGDDLLTEEGTQVFLSWLLHSKYAEDFKTDVVNTLLEEKKKDEE